MRLLLIPCRKQQTAIVTGKNARQSRPGMQTEAAADQRHTLPVSRARVHNAATRETSTCERRGRNRAGSPLRPKTFRHCATRSLKPRPSADALWLSYIFVFLYLAIAAGAVTHKDLFFENPVKLPFLNVELPLIAFFTLGPALFLIVHAYILLHFAMLAGKVGAFHTELEAANQA